MHVNDSEHIRSIKVNLVSFVTYKVMQNVMQLNCLESSNIVG